MWIAFSNVSNSLLMQELKHHKYIIHLPKLPRVNSKEIHNLKV
jgi:hypothetical protein